MSTLFILFVTGILARTTNGHAYVDDPIARNAIGAVDNGLCTWNGPIPCVGDPQSWNQEETSTGCGIIQSGSTPFVFGDGGLSYENTKYITQYSQNELIEAKIKVTAMHGGRYEFRIQDVGSAMDPDGSLWKDLPPLTVESFTPPCNGAGCRDEPCVVEKTCANIPLGAYGTGTGKEMRMMVQLPSNLVCEHCVMQWRYVTGNSCPGGISCEGGEKFWNCIDLKITPTTPVPSPTVAPSRDGDTTRPTVIPTKQPVTTSPTVVPSRDGDTIRPTSPTIAPSRHEHTHTMRPTVSLTNSPSLNPVPVPTIAPSDSIRPTMIPKPVTMAPTRVITGECQPLWSKCGGQSWTGPTCCVEGSLCNSQSKWYSQCVPDASDNSPSKPPTISPTRVTNGECQPNWAKCGGQSW
eukprot:CAMPEP_0119034976 /NCGR_PEP_ID=MMETSP1177-20130426/1970_1 /TAXON_ID=2985 /ORGANISM="Ochromonas sp, Strain CCMP1899" /LENGTH=406 /DNA_ID=CAMNT_0006992823 /DNA_START=132 /DNA_END=1349 /DNA_ORIENTATION=-